MKVVFLCGSLEPGRDGVGDYSRRLAAQLLALDHQAAIVALHDRQLNEPVLEGFQHEEGQAVHTLRLSNTLSWPDRGRYANEFINTMNPDWISLQYVPFSFHDKGLPVGFSRVLRQSVENRPMHIMFHELWVGLSKQSPRQHILWGGIQRYLVRSLLTTLRPCVIHTHTPLYQTELSRLGVQASILPLFSNIPRVSDDCNSSDRLALKAKEQIKLVVFGGIAPGAPVNELADDVAEYATQKKVSIELTIIGRNGRGQDIWATAWRSRGLAVAVLGEQPFERISEILFQSSIGISTTPSALSGKSGAIAAMHAHGLPVLCVSAPWQPRNVTLPQIGPGIAEYTTGNFEQVISSSKEMCLPAVNVIGVTGELVDALAAAPTCNPVNLYPSL